jgi:hypothetical protein
MSPRTGNTYSSRTAPVGVGRELLEPALPVGDRRLHAADVVGRDIDRDPLVGLLELPVDLAEQHLGARHRELEAFPAHLLDQDGELQLTAPADLERLARLGGVELDGDVAQHLALEAAPDLAARDEPALAPGER